MPLKKKSARTLEEYAWFVAQIRGNIASNSDNASSKIEAAIDRAIHDMPKDFEIRNFLISNFLISNRAKVKDMCLTEYNETETLELFRQEGRLEGQQEMMLLNIRNLMDSTGWPAEKIMEMLKIPSDQRKTLSFKLTKNVERGC